MLFRLLFFQCWETYVGQQFYKLAVFNLLIKVATTFLVAYPIGKMAQRYDKCVQLQYEFNLALKFLDILYIQTIFWLALFFSPFLCIFAPFYYFLDYYLLLVSRATIAFFLWLINFLLCFGLRSLNSNIAAS
jgi:hypothetical protein